MIDINAQYEIKFRSFQQLIAYCSTEYWLLAKSIKINSILSVCYLHFWLNSLELICKQFGNEFIQQHSKRHDCRLKKKKSPILISIWFTLDIMKLQESNLYNKGHSHCKSASLYPNRIAINGRALFSHYVWVWLTFEYARKFTFKWMSSISWQNIHQRCHPKALRALI